MVSLIGVFSPSKKVKGPHLNEETDPASNARVLIFGENHLFLAVS